MRFYTNSHRHYCGVDLHARSLYLCVLDADGEVRLHREIKATPEAFLQAIAPFRDDLVVAAECMFAWYWLADLCAAEAIPFVLGHALYMKAIHGGKAKNDRIDAHKIAVLLRGGMIPQAYVYPRHMRATRDLLRRRLHFVRKRAELLAHIQMLNAQGNLPPFSRPLVYRQNRIDAADRFYDPCVARSVDADLALIELHSKTITALELHVVRKAKGHDQQLFHLLRSIPGVGKVLSLTILYEVHDIRRFPSVGQFASYARLVRCSRASAGKIKGTAGHKIGNAHLKWAFSEAAVLFLRKNPDGQRLMKRLRSKHGNAKALSILAHRNGRAAYFMMRRRESFQLSRLLPQSGRRAANLSV